MLVLSLMLYLKLQMHCASVLCSRSSTLRIHIMVCGLFPVYLLFVHTNLYQLLSHQKMKLSFILKSGSMKYEI